MVDTKALKERLDKEGPQYAKYFQIYELITELEELKAYHHACPTHERLRQLRMKLARNYQSLKKLRDGIRKLADE